MNNRAIVRMQGYGMMCLMAMLLLYSGNSFGQGGTKDDGIPQTVEVEYAETFTSKKVNGNEIRTLKGAVRLKHGTATIFCDSAVIMSAEKLVIAGGHIMIQDVNGATMTGERLRYNSQTKQAEVEGNVQLRDGKMTLTTEKLYYDVGSKIGKYLNMGYLDDGETRLSSVKGYYYSTQKKMHFRTGVQLNNPQYRMLTDTLVYEPSSRRSYFYGPTRIFSSGDEVYCEEGYYNTLNGEARFGKNTKITSKGTILEGDSIYYHRVKGYGKARKNVRMTDLGEQLEVTGDVGEHFQLKGVTTMAGRVLVSKGSGEDSIWVRADSFRSQDVIWKPDSASMAKRDSIRMSKPDTAKTRVKRDSSRVVKDIEAKGGVLVWNKGFQAKADTMRYGGIDSLLKLRGRPVAWFSGYEVKGVRINMLLKNKEIERAIVEETALMISLDTSSGLYNQMKGKRMEALFAKNEVYHVDVQGNSESLYVMKDEAEKVVGLNHIVCSDVTIKIQDRQVRRINFKQDPVAKLMPIKDVTMQDERLAGFENRDAERPRTLLDLGWKAPVKESPKKKEATKPKQPVKNKKAAPAKSSKKTTKKAAAKKATK